MPIATIQLIIEGIEAAPQLISTASQLIGLYSAGTLSDVDLAARWNEAVGAVIAAQKAWHDAPSVLA